MWTPDYWLKGGGRAPTFPPSPRTHESGHYFWLFRQNMQTACVLRQSRSNVSGSQWSVTGPCDRPGMAGHFGNSTLVEQSIEWSIMYNSFAFFFFFKERYKRRPDVRAAGGGAIPVLFHFLVTYWFPIFYCRRTLPLEKEIYTYINKNTCVFKQTHIKNMYTSCWNDRMRKPR